MALFATHSATHQSSYSVGPMKQDQKYLIRRGSTLYLKRRVPLRYQSIESRETIWASLKTDSIEQAKSKAAQVWTELIAGWEALLAGADDNARRHHEAAANLAAQKGYQYLTADEIAASSLTDVLERIEAIPLRLGRPDAAVAKALLGGAPKPSMRVSEALEEYWTLSRDKTHGKSPDQIRRWENPRKKAVRNFIDVVGDKDLAEITRDDFVHFRSWWMDRLEEKDLTANSANKDFIHLSSVLNAVIEMKSLGVSLDSKGLTLKEVEQKDRPQFSEAWIRDKLLAPGALDGLHEEARGIFLGMINTGARPSELANLRPERIVLDHDFPHIDIRPDGRELKSANAKRKIPLVGCSLEALKSFPSGFPRYHDNPGLSDEVNGFLSKRGLRETPAHTMYSLRHSFEERLRIGKVDDRLRAVLFGHPYHRERYARPSLKELTEAVQPLAL